VDWRFVVGGLVSRIAAIGTDESDDAGSSKPLESVG
jgi:hypothetical protein